MKEFISKPVIVYILKFAGAFCIFYFGTLAIIGLSAPEGYYNSFVAKYLNYVEWLRMSLLYSSKLLLSFFDYPSFITGKYILQLQQGAAIKMVYKCAGYGVMSFWAAFIIANTAAFLKKIRWVFIGLVTIWVINVLRISLLLVALQKNWEIPLGLDHHTWFNIFSYMFIFLLIYLYDKSQRSTSLTLETKNGTV